MKMMMTHTSNGTNKRTKQTKQTGKQNSSHQTHTFHTQVPLHIARNWGRADDYKYTTHAKCTCTWYGITGQRRAAKTHQVEHPRHNVRVLVHAGRVGAETRQGGLTQLQAARQHHGPRHGHAAKHAHDVVGHKQVRAVQVPGTHGLQVLKQRGNLRQGGGGGRGEGGGGMGRVRGTMAQTQAPPSTTARPHSQPSKEQNTQPYTRTHTRAQRHARTSGSPPEVADREVHRL